MIWRRLLLLFVLALGACVHTGSVEPGVTSHRVDPSHCSALPFDQRVGLRGTLVGCGRRFHFDGCSVYSIEDARLEQRNVMCQEVWRAGVRHGWLRMPAFLSNEGTVIFGDCEGYGRLVPVELDRDGRIMSRGEGQRGMAMRFPGRSACVLRYEPRPLEELVPDAWLEGVVPWTPNSVPPFSLQELQNWIRELEPESSMGDSSR